jgi:hypothetical protein
MPPTTRALAEARAQARSLRPPSTSIETRFPELRLLGVGELVRLRDAFDEGDTATIADPGARALARLAVALEVEGAVAEGVEDADHSPAR